MMITNFGFGNSITAIVPTINYRYYGYFYDTTTQTAVENSPTAMKLNTIFLSNGVSVVSGTKITVANTWVYNVQFSAQFYRSSGGTKETIDIWLRKNGVDVPQSNTKITLENNGIFVVAARNWLIQLNAGEDCEIMWSVTSNTIRIASEPENLIVPHPATPSVIATCVQV